MLGFVWLTLCFPESSCIWVKDKHTDIIESSCQRCSLNLAPPPPTLWVSEVAGGQVVWQPDRPPLHAHTHTHSCMQHACTAHSHTNNTRLWVCYVQHYSPNTNKTETLPVYVCCTFRSHFHISMQTPFESLKAVIKVIGLVKGFRG